MGDYIEERVLRKKFLVATTPQPNTSASEDEVEILASPEVLAVSEALGAMEVEAPPLQPATTDVSVESPPPSAS